MRNILIISALFISFLSVAVFGQQHHVRNLTTRLGTIDTFWTTFEKVLKNRKLHVLEDPTAVITGFQVTMVSKGAEYVGPFSYIGDSLSDETMNYIKHNGWLVVVIIEPVKVRARDGQNMSATPVVLRVDCSALYPRLQETK